MVPTETCHGTGGRRKEKEKGPRRVGEHGWSWKGMQAGRGCMPVFCQPGREAWMESWRGRCPQLTASWASAQKARPPDPIMLSILLRFKRGNVLFISHQPVETWQPPDGSDPTKIFVNSGHLSCLPNVGVLTAKSWRCLEVKGKRELSLLFSVAFMRLLGFE